MFRYMTKRGRFNLYRLFQNKRGSRDKHKPHAPRAQKGGNMERVKSGLENEIAAIFKKHTKKGRESEVAGVINGVLPEYFRQLETGNWSEEYPTTGFIQREENKDAASNVISGFLWAMDAAGLISSDKRGEMQKQLSELRFKKEDAAYYKELERAAAAEGNKEQ